MFLTWALRSHLLGCCRAFERIEMMSADGDDRMCDGCGPPHLLERVHKLVDQIVRQSFGG